MTSTMSEAVAGLDKLSIEPSIINASPPPKSLREEGNAAFAAGNFESAAELYSKAISLDPTDILPWCNRSAAYLKTNLPMHAWADAVQATLLDSSNIKALIRAAMAYEAMDLFDEAEGCYQSLLPDVVIAKMSMSGKVPLGLSAVVNDLARRLVKCREKKAEKEMEYAKTTFGRHAFAHGEKHSAEDMVKIQQQFMREGVARIPGECRSGPGGPRDLEVVFAALQPLTKPWPVELRIVPGKGIGVFAKKRIKKGTVFFTEAPGICVWLDDKLCYHCVRKFDASMEVVGCGEGCPKRYCSVECRDRAMELYHAPLCHHHAILGELESCAARGRSGSSRMPLLAWKMLGLALQQRKPGQKYLSVAPADVYPYNHLMRVTDAPPGLERDMDIQSNAAFYLRVWRTIHACPDISGDPLLGMKWLLDFNSIFVANGISLSPQDGSSDVMKRGQAIMLPGTMFNHSCAPNSAYSSPIDNKIEFHATEAIDAGEEITISYCFEEAPVKDRQQVLQATYRFTCECKKCKRELKSTA